MLYVFTEMSGEYINNKERMIVGVRTSWTFLGIIHSLFLIMKHY